MHTYEGGCGKPKGLELTATQTKYIIKIKNC